ncbi:hypothetical protein HGB25_03510 [Candidatus Saccharibacteria bacterium]|nr:hypothetical protein [Candidatus Saccharibacteria bacterium]
MSDKMYDEIAVERVIKEYFGVDNEIQQIILNHAPVGRTSNATLFLTNKKQLFLFITGQSKLLLGDVRKVIARMGLKADIYFPPKGRRNYFDEVGRDKFHEVFPGRKNINDDDIRFYRTLAPYNPALVLISDVTDGHVYQYDEDSNTKWRVGAKFAYRRIKTS